MDNLDPGTHWESLLAAFDRFVATQQQIADNLTRINATLQAFTSKEMSDYEPKFKRRLTEYADFDWSKIDAKPASWDNDGFVSSVEYLGFIWTRRCSRDNDTYGNTIRFNRTKKGDGKDIEYLDLIAFSEKGATINPLSDSVRAIVKQSQKNKTGRPPFNGNKQVTTSQPPALSQNSQKPSTAPNSRPNASYPLQSKQPAVPQQALTEPQLKEKKRAELGRLIRDCNISTEKVKTISMERYGVDSSAQMNSEQIEDICRHLKVLYLANPAPVHN